MTPDVHAEQPDDGRQSLIGSTGYHARVVLCTITDKEFPAAFNVLERLGKMVEVDGTGAYTFESCLSLRELPFVLVQSEARANLYAASSVYKWIRDFRPQHFLVIGTAGGIHRPADDKVEPYEWKGPARGDVVVSEYVHYGNFMKIAQAGGQDGDTSSSDYLMRYLAIEQPSTMLLTHARGVMRDPSWAEFTTGLRKESDSVPSATVEEILVGEAVVDNPLEPAQQFLMKHFDRVGAVEMESVGVAQLLHSLRESVHYAPGFIAIRGISDIVHARGRRRALTDSDLPQIAEDETPENKTIERGLWSADAAASASAFAVALMARLVRAAQPAQPGHRKIDGYTLPGLPPVSDPPASLKS
jgi:nucleoside phosphorylase